MGPRREAYNITSALCTYRYAHNCCAEFKPSAARPEIRSAAGVVDRDINLEPGKLVISLNS